MTAPRWVEQYLGIPFADDETSRAKPSRAGCNCIGLVHLVLKERAGVHIPAYEEISATDLLASARAFKKAIDGDPWSVVQGDPRPFDCALMLAMSDDLRTDTWGHVGIVVGPNMVLHIWRETLSVVMPFNHIRIRNRIVSFHRHKDLP